MPSPDQSINDLLAACLQAVEDAYFPYEGGPQELPARRYISDQPVPAWDGAQVTVRLTRAYLVEGNIEAEAQHSFFHEGAQLALEVGIEIVRPSPVMNPGGFGGDTPPTEQDISDAANVLHNDITLVWQAMESAYEMGALPGCGGTQWMGWAPKGGGGLTGGETTVKVRVD